MRSYEVGLALRIFIIYIVTANSEGCAVLYTGPPEPSLFANTSSPKGNDAHLSPMCQCQTSFKKNVSDQQQPRKSGGINFFDNEGWLTP